VHHHERDSRLCLYVVCQSYLPRACFEFADMVHRIDDACTAGCVALSEEAQWLRNACSRNRARLIAEVCSEMGIRVPMVEDYSACPPPFLSSPSGEGAVGGSEEEEGEGGGPQQPTRGRKTMMALVCVETLHHDLRLVVNSSGSGSDYHSNHNHNHNNNNNQPQQLSQKKVRLLNYCAETVQAFNGVSCVMAPWEAVWVFRGTSFSDNGDVFGQPKGKRHLVLPTTTARTLDRTVAPLLTFSSVAALHNCRALQVFSGGSSPTSSLSLLSSSSSSSSSRRRRRRDQQRQLLLLVAHHQHHPHSQSHSHSHSHSHSQYNSGSSRQLSLNLNNNNNNNNNNHYYNINNNNNNEEGGEAAANNKNNQQQQQQDGGDHQEHQNNVYACYRRVLAKQSFLSSLEEEEANDSLSGATSASGATATTTNTTTSTTTTTSSTEGGGGARKRLEHQYLVFDETVLQQMASLGWVRSEGVSKLMPLAVGIHEHWLSR
jgi:hypothetical protein